MEIKSLGYKTDLIFPAFDGEIIDRGKYLVVRTPSNPTFFWGNFLLFASPPAEGDCGRWHKLFATEIGVPPQTWHITFGWDMVNREQGIVAPFLADGFHLEQTTVLTARALRPPSRAAEGLSIRPFRSDDDWAQSVDNQVAARAPEFAESEYRTFRERAMDRYRRMAASGRGDWFGGFVDGKLVADLGIFHSGKLGRYQSVQTHPEYRRRGYAGALVCEASKIAINRFGLETLVIVADTDSAAGRLYRSLGFEATEYQVGLEKHSTPQPQNG